MKNKELKFKNVKKVFPDGYTKIRMPYGLRQLVKNKGRYMSLKEIQQVQKLDSNWNKSLAELGAAEFEFYVKRGRKSVKLIPFSER